MKRLCNRTVAGISENKNPFGIIFTHCGNGMEHNRPIWPHNVICHNTIIVDPIQQNPDLAVAQPLFRDQRVALAYLSMSRARHMTCCWSPVHRTQFSLGYGLICQKTFFSSFEKKAPNRLQKRVRNGSPSVPLLRLKARF